MSETPRPPDALPATTHELNIVADGVNVQGREVLILLPNGEMKVMLAVMGVVTQSILKPVGEIHLGIRAMIDGRPINFVTYKKGDQFCRTANDRPCAVMIGTMRGDLEDDFIQVWRLKVPDLKVVDCRPVMA